MTVYDDTLSEIALNSKVYDTWKAFRGKHKRCSIDAVHTKYRQTIYVTWLKIRNRTGDLSIYQGRVPSEVFQASYLNTHVREDRERILKALFQLKGCIKVEVIMMMVAICTLSLSSKLRLPTFHMSCKLLD